MNPELERAETEAFADMCRAAPDLAEHLELDGTRCFVIRSVESRVINRVMGLRTTARLDEIARFYGETPYWISDSRGLGPELERRGFTEDYGWMTFARDVGQYEAPTDLLIEATGAERGADFGAVVAAAFELPVELADWTGRLPGRPGWTCFLALEGDTPAGAGALYAHRDVGWLSFGATLPEFRGRGAQSAILSARFDAAREQGCTVVVTETGELRIGRPSPSYRNIVRAGFREQGVRPNYRAPRDPAGRIIRSA